MDGLSKIKCAGTRQNMNPESSLKPRKGGGKGSTQDGLGMGWVA